MKKIKEEVEQTVIDPIVKEVFDEEFKKQKYFTDDGYKLDKINGDPHVLNDYDYRLYLKVISKITIDNINFQSMKEYICELYDYIIYYELNDVTLLLMINILIELAKKDEYKGEDKNAILDNAEGLKNYACGVIRSKFDDFLDNASTPYSFIVLPYIQNGKIQYRENGNLQIRTLYIPYCNKFMHDLIKEFILQTNCFNNINEIGKYTMTIECLFNEFDARKYKNVNSFNDDTFKSHLDYLIKYINKKKYKESTKSSFMSVIIKFYAFIEKKMDKDLYSSNFRKYDLTAFNYLYFTKRYREGADIYNYSIYEKPPRDDKFMLKPQKMSLHDNGQDVTVVYVDFSIIDNEYVREIIKEMYWKDTIHNIKYRNKTYSYLIEIANKFFTGEYGVIEKHNIEVNVTMLVNIKFEYQNATGHKLEMITSMMKYFLKFLKDNKYAHIENYMFNMFSINGFSQHAYKDRYSKSEVRNLITSYEREYYTEDNEDLKQRKYIYYIAFKMFVINQMRVSSVVNTKTNSLIEVLDSKDVSKKEYNLRVVTKVSKSEKRDIPITDTTKQLFELALESTKELRENLNTYEKEYLFIYKSRRHGIISKINECSIAHYHQTICEKYKIPYKPLAAVRNMYMNTVSDIERNAGNNDKHTELLTDHTLDIHYKNYVSVDITKICQDFYLTEVGDVTLKGSVDSKEVEDKSKTVDEGSGYCNKDECTVLGNLNCTLCPNFVTTISCIPEIKKCIKKIDEQIEKETAQHARELLYLRKKIYVGYLINLYELKEKGE